jgi:hypothetical protein
VRRFVEDIGILILRWFHELREVVRNRGWFLDFHWGWRCRDLAHHAESRLNDINRVRGCLFRSDGRWRCRGSLSTFRKWLNRWLLCYLRVFGEVGVG